MLIHEEIKNIIEKSIKELWEEKVFPKFDIPEFQIEHPEKKIYGDYATNVAMVVAKILKKNPLEIAETINLKVKTKKSKVFAGIEIAKPGFIDFFLSKEYLQKQIEKVLKTEEKFGQLKIGKKRKIQVEFISANPAGSLHIGHGRGAFLGDTLANILEKYGFKVTREYYINDAKVSSQIKELGKTALGKGKSYLTEDLKSKISKLKFKIENLKKKKIKNLEGEAGYLLTQEIQRENKKFIEKELKIKFDNWFSEESLYQNGAVEKLLKDLEKKNLVYKK